MHIGKKVEGLINERKINISEFANELGKSRQYIYDLFEKPHVSTDILEKIALFFNLPIIFFLDESVQDSQIVQSKDYRRLWEEVSKNFEISEAKLKAKEEVIQSYEKRIADLKGVQEVLENIIKTLKS